MKKLLLTLCSGILIFGTAAAQCTSSVDANSEVVQAPTQRNAGNAFYWVCNGGSLTLTGDYNNIWVENGGIASVSGDSNVVYVKEGGKVFIAENYNIVWVDSKVVQAGDYNDNGTFTDKTNCNPAVFQYTSAPANGCDVFANVPEVTVVKDAKIYPSPASDILTIEFPPSNASYRVEIFDMSGKLAMENTFNTSDGKMNLDVSSLTSGQYSLRATSGNILVNKQISIGDR